MRPTTDIRDYELAAQLARLPGYALVGTREVAAVTGFALNSVRQRKVPLPPAAYASRRKVLWRLQDIRDWLVRLELVQGTGRARRRSRIRSESVRAARGITAGEVR